MSTTASPGLPSRPAAPRIARVRVLLVLMSALAVLALSACKPPEPGTASNGAASGGEAADGLRLSAEVNGATVGLAPVVVEVFDETAEVAGDSTPVSGASVEVLGEMSHAGMQPVIVSAVETEPGLYRADEFAFTMAGDWFVTVSVTAPDGREAVWETFVNVSSQ